MGTDPPRLGAPWALGSPDIGAWLRLLAAGTLAGVVAGLVGAIVILIITGLQHLAFGYEVGSFFEGIEQSDPVRRVVALGVSGCLGAAAWWLLRTRGRPVVSVAEALQGRRMPAVETLGDASAQFVTVGLGASLGRELAPRLVAAMIGQRLAGALRLGHSDATIVVGCAAGAGLAAVYDIPLAGAVFALEVALAAFSLRAAVIAMLSSAIAAWIAGVVVPAPPLEPTSGLSGSAALSVWALLAGPVLGLGGALFVRAVRTLERRRPPGAWLLLVMPLAYLAVGALSVAEPAVLGDGKPMLQATITGLLPLGALALLLLAKAAATLGTIGAGAAGGTLTPALAMGSGVGALLGAAWSLLWPGVPPAAFALVGACAFLASSMRAPLTATVIALELFALGPGMLLPLMLAVAGAALMGRWAERMPRLRGVT